MATWKRGKDEPFTVLCRGPINGDETMTASVKKAVTKNKLSPGDDVAALFTLTGEFAAEDVDAGVPPRFDFLATRTQTESLSVGDYVIDIKVELVGRTVMLPTEVITVVERVTE
jgi:hypothetical protein